MCWVGVPDTFHLWKSDQTRFNLKAQRWIWYLDTFESSVIKFSQHPRRPHGEPVLIKALVSCDFIFPHSCVCLCLQGKAELWYIECISSLGQQHHGSYASICKSLLWGGWEAKLDVHCRERCREEIPQGTAWQWCSDAEHMKHDLDASQKLCPCF